VKRTSVGALLCISVFATACGFSRSEPPTVAGEIAPPTSAQPTASPLPTAKPLPLPVDLSNPISVLESFYYDANVGQIDAAMDLVAEDAVLLDPGGFPGELLFLGKDEIRRFLIEGFGGGSTIQVSNASEDASGVSYTRENYNNGGLVHAWDFMLAVVRDGKILFDGQYGMWILYCNRNPLHASCTED